MDGRFSSRGGDWCTYVEVFVLQERSFHYLFFSAVACIEGAPEMGGGSVHPLDLYMKVDFQSANVY